MRTHFFIFCCCILGSFVFGQSVGSGDQPRCYFFEKAPSTWNSGDFNERFTPMVRVNLTFDDVLQQSRDLSGYDTALLVKEQVDGLVAQFPAFETYIRTHVVILLQNFGSEGQTLFAQDDVDEPDWDSAEQDPWQQRAEANPWLNTGILAAHTWMHEFVETDLTQEPWTHFVNSVGQPRTARG
ncbi:MAG: hypothetical protein JSR77_08425, partial [Planctomycetes bacterium]|nr:hypothetical protein [Planctomycetota bacterium]